MHVVQERIFGTTFLLWVEICPIMHPLMNFNIIKKYKFFRMKKFQVFKSTLVFVYVCFVCVFILVPFLSNFRKQQ